MPPLPITPAALTSRGNVLSDRYALTGDAADLGAAVRDYLQAVDLTPERSPQRAEILNNLATGVEDRYARTGDLEDLNEALRVYRQAMELTPARSLSVPGLSTAWAPGSRPATPAPMTSTGGPSMPPCRCRVSPMR